MSLQTSVTTDAACGTATFHVDYAPFDTQIQIVVDGKVVHTFTHVPTDDGPRVVETWTGTFTPGAHYAYAEEWQADAQHFPHGYNGNSPDDHVTPAFVVTACTVPTPPATRLPAEPSTIAAAPALAVDATIVVDETAAPVTTVATVGAPTTLPSTGAATGPLVGAGFAFLTLGVKALRAARRVAS
jgi:hypothetical protein